MYIGINQDITPFSDSLINRLFLNTAVPIFYHKVFVSYSKVPFWDEHYAFFKEVAYRLNSNLPSNFMYYPRFLVRLVNKNKFFNGALVKIVFFPQQDGLQFLAIPQKSDFERLALIKDKIIVQKTSRVKPDGGLNFVHAYDLHHYNIYKTVDFKRPLLISNSVGKVLENQLGSFILIEKNNVYSPDYKNGAYFNAIQLKVLEILQNMGFKIYFQPFDYSRFSSASEAWIVNDRGIYARVGIDVIRYQYGDLSQKVFDKLSEMFDKEPVLV